jgi:hypothetical protein
MASSWSVQGTGSEEELGPLHTTWSVADFAWDGEELFQVTIFVERLLGRGRVTRAPLLTARCTRAAQAFPRPEANAARRRDPRAVASRRAAKTCLVAGCAVSLKDCPAYHVRYRLCDEHLRASAVDIDGVASRFCQTCSRFQPMSLFAGARRTCTLQLEAARTRREARLRRAAAAPPPTHGAVAVAEDDLVSWLLLPEGVTPPPPHPLNADVAALLGPPQAEHARAVVASVDAPALYAASFALKLPQATPDTLPSAGAAALRAWAEDPLLLVGVAQPGCVILTVDALWAAEPALKSRDSATMLAALLHCAADAEERNSLRHAHAVVAPTLGAACLPLPLRCVALVGPGATAVTLALAAAPSGGAQLRARAHGQLLPVTGSGDAVTVQLPAGDTPTLLLLDMQDDGGMALAQPRAVLLSRDADVATELQAAFRALPSEEAVHALVCLLGGALHRGGARADPGLLAAAATAAASSGLVATLATLLSALVGLPAPYRTGLLAAAAAAAQPAAVALLLRRGGAGELFGSAPDALFAAALAATDARDEARAARATQICAALTAHGDGGIAWFDATYEVAGATRRVVTPAAAAALGSSAACVRLCTRLASRRAAAHALVAAAAAKLPPDTSRGAALAALLASLPMPMLPGSLLANAEDDAETACAADLALAMLRRAAARHAAAVDDAALLRLSLARPYAFVPVLTIAAYVRRVLPEPLLRDAHLRAAAEADAQLSTLAYLRLEAVRVVGSLVFAMLVCVLAFMSATIAPIWFKRRVSKMRDALVACFLTVTQLAFFWLSLRSVEQLPQPPRVHPFATVAKLLFSAQIMETVSALPHKIAAPLYLLRATIVLAATLLPRCLFMPRSWLTSWSLLPHVAIHLWLAWRAWAQHRVNLRDAAALRLKKAD